MMDRRGLLVGLAAGSGVVSLSPVVHAACLPTAQQAVVHGGVRVTWGSPGNNENHTACAATAIVNTD